VNNQNDEYLYISLILLSVFCLGYVALDHYFLPYLIAIYRINSPVTVYYVFFIIFFFISLLSLIYAIKHMKAARAYFPLAIRMATTTAITVWALEENSHDTYVFSSIENIHDPAVRAELLKIPNNQSASSDAVYAALYADGHKEPVDKYALLEMVHGQYSELERILADLHQKVDADISNEILVNDAYSIFGKNPDDEFELALEKWVAKTGSYQAYTARGIYLHSKGWSIRGTETVKNTPEENMKDMNNVFVRAIANLTKALELSERNTAAYWYLIESYGVVGNSKAATRTLEQALRIYPYTYKIRSIYLNYHLEPKWGGSYKKMLNFSNDALRYADNNPRLIGLTAETLYTIGMALEDTDTDVAIDFYKRALTYAPHNNIYMALARIYQNKSDTDNELEQYNRILTKSPGYARALIGRSIIHVERNMPQEAIRDASYAITLDKGVWVTTKAGWVFETAQDYKQAITAYQLAVLDDPTYDYPYNRLVTLHIWLNKDYKTAFEVAKAMCKYFPNNPDSWLYAADYAYDLHMKDAEMYISKYFAIVDKKGVSNQEMHAAAVRLRDDIRKR
jgi:tetratricopeptide (TPR) repeat protein